MANLEIKQLSKEFGDFRALDNVTIDIPDGAFVSFLGPSGCGKTTTLRCVAGLEQASSGHVNFRGHDIGALPVEKRNIGMVFQNYALFPHLTIEQNVAFGLEMRGMNRKEAIPKVESMLGLVQLTGMNKRYPRELSGGQQQRVALARALVFSPDILLLDEPLANLDAKLRIEMRAFIRDIQQKVGITAIYVTHDQSEAMTMSDKVVVMFNGRVHQYDTPAKIYAEPQTEAVASFIGAANILSGSVKGSDFETGFAKLSVRGAKSSHNGSAVLRPEDIALSSGNLPEGFPVTVQGAEFLGNLVHYKVLTSTGEALSVQQLGNQLFEPGQQAWATVGDRGVWVLP